MHLGEVIVRPGVKRALTINVDDYVGADDEVSGDPEWTVPTGVTLEADSFTDDVALAIVTPSQEGCDYLVECAIELDSGATEKFTILVKCQTSDVDPRLAR